MRKVASVVIFLTFSVSIRAAAAWSISGGYNNPVQALVGANILHTWTTWAFEAGLGYARPDSGGLQFAGDMDFKYMFMGGSFRPFLQLGTGWAFSTNLENNNFGFGSDNIFSGVGFFVFGSGVYTYASYNTGPPGLFLQAGLGFDL